MRYLHKFSDEFEFDKIYNRGMSGVKSFTCSKGEFSFDEAVEISGETLYKWVGESGDTLYTLSTTVIVGDEAFDLTNNLYEITAVTVDENKQYRKPWVGLTKMENGVVGCIDSHGSGYTYICDSAYYG